MMDVTEIILNFQKLLAAIANSLSVIGLYKGSDEWDELTEDAFRALVVNYLAERFDISISHQYEMWGQTNREIVVRVSVGESLLVGLKDGSSECQYRYDEISESDNDVEFSFVEFWNPTFDEKDLKGLEYVMGLDEEGRIICARNKGCKFFTKT